LSTHKKKLISENRKGENAKVPSYLKDYIKQHIKRLLLFFILKGKKTNNKYNKRW